MARVYWVLGDTKIGNYYAAMSLELLNKQRYIREVGPEHLEAMVRSISDDLDLVEGKGRAKERSRGGRDYGFLGNE